MLTTLNGKIIMFRAQRKFLLIATRAMKPHDEDLSTLLKDTAGSIEEIQSFRDTFLARLHLFFPTFKTFKRRARPLSCFEFYLIFMIQKCYLGKKTDDLIFSTIYLQFRRA